MNYETQRFRHRRRQRVAKQSTNEKYFPIRKMRFMMPAGIVGWAIVVAGGASVAYDLFAGTPQEITFNAVARIVALAVFVGPVAWVRDEVWIRVLVIGAGVPILFLAQPVIGARVVCILFGDCS